MNAAEAKKLTKQNKKFANYSGDLKLCLKYIESAAKGGEGHFNFCLNGGAHYYGGLNDKGEQFKKDLEKLGYYISGCSTGPTTGMAVFYVTW